MRSLPSFRFFPTILLGLLPFTGSRAGIGLDFSLWYVRDSNAFRNHEKIPDQIMQPGLTVFYFHPGKAFRFRIQYSGNWTSFERYAQRQFIFHSGGLNGQWTPPNRPIRLYWGGEYGVRRNESAYQFYDYRNGSAYCNLRLEEGEVGSTLIGSTARQRQYGALTQFDFIEWTATMRQHFYLPTRTTLIVMARWGHKRFTGSPEGGPEPEEIADLVDPGKSRGANPPGKGKGKPTAQSVPVDPSVYVSVSGDAVSQRILSVRLAQSLSSSTGIALETGGSRFLRGKGRILSHQDGGYEEEDILFDDPYNYEGETISLELTRMLPFSILFKSGWDAETKRYISPAFDSDGNPADAGRRSDRMTIWWIRMTRSFPWFKGSEIHFSIRKIHNDSNDPYFDYTGSVIALGWLLRF